MSTQSAEFSWSVMSEIKRQNVRRCLFGRPDPEKLSENLKRQDKIFSDAEVTRFHEKWAYDPVTGPLNDSDYELVTEGSLNEIPSFYTKGYSSSLKSKPVFLMQDVTCYIGVRNRTVKRKLNLDDNIDEGNSENFENVNKCVGLLNESRFQSLSSDIPVVGDIMCGHLYDSSSLGLSRSSSAPTLSELSPVSRNTDIMTPPSRPRPQVQSSIKDYLSTKKQRMNTKALPRT